MKAEGRITTASGNRRRFATAMAAPPFVILAVMTAYPLIFTVLYSFTNFQLLRKTVKFVGLKNYIKLFTNEYFLQSIGVTVKFTVFAVLFEVAVGFIMALFVESIHRERTAKILRVLLLVPYLLPSVTVALSWRMMLSPNYGIINRTLEALRLPVYNWFSDLHTALPMLILLDIWQNAPFVFLLLYAAMQSVPQSQYEAARMDGASYVQQVRFITVPGIAPVLALCALLRTIDSFRIFDKVNLLTGGGPANSTTTITQYLYAYGIKNLKFGFGSAGAIIMTLIVLVLSCLYIKKAVK